MEGEEKEPSYDKLVMVFTIGLSGKKTKNDFPILNYDLFESFLTKGNVLEEDKNKFLLHACMGGKSNFVKLLVSNGAKFKQ